MQPHPVRARVKHLCMQGVERLDVQCVREVSADSDRAELRLARPPTDVRFEVEARVNELRVRYASLFEASLKDRGFIKVRAMQASQVEPDLVKARTDERSIFQARAAEVDAI